MPPYKVSVVSYLNSQPFISGLENHPVKEKIILSQDYPAKCAEKLINGEADIALLPVAIIPQLKTPHIISDYCIGAVGQVKTVCLFSEVPLEEIETVYLDYQSRTSVRLLQMLCEEYWNIEPRFVPAHPGYMSEIKGNVAGVIIGDRAIAYLEHYFYVYDLSEAWLNYTGFPFVFAAWVANKQMDRNFVDCFNQALSTGLLMRNQLANQFSYLNNEQFNSSEYLHKNISYLLDETKKEGMTLFLDKLCKLDGCPVPELFFSEV
jgi:chorismate dehydratase